MPEFAPAPDLSAWPTQTEAAVRLATNERTIRRFIAAGRLRAEKRPVVGAKPQTVIDPEDVARVRAEREREKPVVIESGHEPDRMPDAMPDVRTGTELSRIEPAAAALAELFAGAARALAAAQQVPVPTLPGPFVSLAEAVTLSGMPASWLIAQAKAGAPWAVNIGQGKKAFWRFSIARRDSL